MERIGWVTLALSVPLGIAVNLLTPSIKKLLTRLSPSYREKVRREREAQEKALAEVVTPHPELMMLVLSQMQTAVHRASFITVLGAVQFTFANVLDIRFSGSATMPPVVSDIFTLLMTTMGVFMVGYGANQYHQGLRQLREFQWTGIKLWIKSDSYREKVTSFWRDYPQNSADSGGPIPRSRSGAQTEPEPGPSTPEQHKKKTPSVNEGGVAQG